MSAVPSLTLSVHDATGSRRIVVDGAGATLGRGTDCSVVLADTRRAISRLQARIDWRDGHYLLTDSGSNPTLVNGRIPGVSREVVLHDGDTLTIDVYRIVIEIEGASHGEDATVFAALAGREEEEVDAPTMVRVPEREAADLVDAVTQLRAADQAQAAPSESGALDAVDELPDTPTMVRLPVIATPQAPQAPQAAPTQQQASSITQVAPSMQAGPLESVEAATTRHAEPIDPTAHDTLLVALCDGLGIDAASLAGRNATDVARLAGALLRDAVGGAMAALRTGHMPGAAAGPELDGADPLRDRGDVETALRLLLSASAASASRDRLRDAFGELRDRQLALRGGLREVLAGLDPARLDPETAGWRDWLPGSAARLRAQYARDWTRVSRQAAATLDSALAAPSQQAPN
ncbi:type VI secretion system-associated FHA domain protein TagH [Burkholderia gladioli]|uniref:type VI secretion system-associated FHA domain protein TagH n=1 Tax=Burkholderia gladioli TaxID=28095 RepID=UPI0013DE0C22|nr:type VI secretion system-associated FHA domain protein TagH [Burkholderia gladioli]MBJ9714314.1 type VI secretion system-associated FHA domain protein TagH [Burkholderia gladioli]MBU9159882.1 type VI secretion system-associated FHA domain protein TagH [Burkholderia gladioli]MCH7273479.1 type VI secretion system-associated FHA domain protein TagH [Burkholderia gladioli]MDR8086016.1 type VI secretion system-associated FHA domain protein TagH [Burkholderia gladioli]MDZ4041132.1 type VI secreti